MQSDVRTATITTGAVFPRDAGDIVRQIIRQWIVVDIFLEKIIVG